MWLITRNAEEYRSMTAQLMLQNLPIVSGPFGTFCALRHPNYLVLACANNRLPIPRGPCSSKSRFFLYWLYDCIFQLQVLSLIYARVTRVPPQDFAFWAKSLRGQQHYFCFRRFKLLMPSYLHQFLWNRLLKGKRIVIRRWLYRFLCLIITLTT